MRNPIHVAMFTPSASGGHARYTQELLAGLHRLGAQELRLSLVTSEDLQEEFRGGDYGIHDFLPRLAPRDSFHSKTHWAAARVLHYRRRDAALLDWVRQQGGVDVVHYQEPPLIPPLHFNAMKATGARLVATVHNVVPHRYHVPLLRPVSDALARFGWRTCDALFVHAQSLREQLGRDLGRGAPRIFVSPHVTYSVGSVVDVPVEDRLAARTLTLFGVQRRNKGQHLILDAMRSLPGFRLVLAGAFEEPGLLEEIEARVRKECLLVEILNGFLSNEAVAKLFARTTLSVLPYTDFHAESGVLHLAASYRVPVVVADVGALGETVRRAAIGTIVMPRSASALAAGVLAAMEPSNYRAASRACEDVAGVRSVEAARATLDGYRAVMQKTRP